MERVKTFEREVVVVTGAASGIGRLTALAFAARGARVALADVNEAGLETARRACLQAGADGALAAHVDVGDAAAVDAFAARVETELGPTFVLVNNAGVGLSGGLMQTKLEDWEWLLRVNLWGAIHGLRAFAPSMIARRRGRIVNVASASGFCNLPALAAYGTTKYAVVGLSEAAREELRPHGIAVSVVCPGFVATDIVESARIRSGENEAREREELRAFYARAARDPATVAAAIVRAAERGRGLVPVTAEAWLLYGLKRAFPALIPPLLRLASRYRAG